MSPARSCRSCASTAPVTLSRSRRPPASSGLRSVRPTPRRSSASRRAASRAENRRSSRGRWSRSRAKRSRRAASSPAPMPSASLSRRSLTSRRKSPPTATSRPLSPSTWPRSRSPHETPHGSGRVAVRARFAIRPPRGGHRFLWSGRSPGRINARFADNDPHAKWLTAFQHGISSILHGLGTHRPPVPDERPVTRVWRPRDLRARRSNGMAHPPTGPDPHRHGRIRMGAAMGGSSRRNPAGRCCLHPAGSEALAWSHSSHGRDPYRHSGTARREGRRVAGAGQRRTISGALRMPHVIVKLWPGKSEQQKRRLTEAIVKDVMNVLNYGDESVSVAIEEVTAGDWAEKVYKPDIVKTSAKLYKKPGYTM